MKKSVLVAGLLAGLLCLPACQAQSNSSASSQESESTSGTESSASSDTDTADEVYEDTQELMGTYIFVRAYGEHAQAGVEAAFARAEELEQIFSNTIEDSEVNQVNQAAKAAPSTAIAISSELETVLDAALEYGSKSNGMLDCTMGDLIDLWGIGTDHAAVPEDSQIEALLRTDGWQDVSLDSEAHTLTFSTDAVTLNFGAVAKGYISDEMKAAMEDAGVTSGLMSLGGNVMTLGAKPDGSNWTVAITDPFSPEDIMASVTVTDMSVITSGNYEKYFEEDGKRYHHILDPTTGAPSESDVVSTTILTEKGLDGDALSTSTFLMGADAGMELINSMEGVEAVFVKSDGTVVTSDGIEAYNFQEISS